MSAQAIWIALQRQYQHSPLLKLLWFVVYAGFIAIAGLIPSWLLDWNKLVLTTSLVSALLVFLVGVIEALKALELAHGNQVGAQSLADLEKEVLSWHGVTPEVLATLKQLALTV